MSLEPQPKYLDPEEAARAHAILARPSGVPTGHGSARDLAGPHTEEVTEGKPLSDDKTWFYPGLAYCMVGLDKSMFELFSLHSGKSVKVTTHLSNKPIMEFEGVDVSRNPWFHTIQGIDSDIAPDVVGLIQSYAFNDSVRGSSWSISFDAVRIADPFSEQKRGVTVLAALPVCRATQRAVKVLTQLDLHLSTPQLGMIKLPQNEPKLII